MDADLLALRLEQARLAADLGLQLIAEQRLILGQCEAFGQDATSERRILRLFEAMQDRHLEDIECATEQLAAALQRKSA